MRNMKKAMKLFVSRLHVITVCALLVFCIPFPFTATAQTTVQSKKISPDLFGLFFEDINYSADGGLYAELVQNRSFEYIPTEQKGWNPFSFWEYTTTNYSYGSISVETSAPVHPNNPHYMVLTIEHLGEKGGVGMKNFGFDGMALKAGDAYNFSVFARQLSSKPVTLTVSLQNRSGKILAESSFYTSSADWKKYAVTLTPTESYDSTTLVILATTKGKIAFDMVSLFPEKTFNNRPNGLRADLAQTLADMKPGFVRFPGGCLVHGDGLANMYRWENTIGPIEQRKEQRNIWGYHQTAGLGYYEYFQFCEDIGAKPLPVLPAAVSCQNSGGTWRIGGTGQQALPMEEMQDYIQEVLHLIEWANGPANSEWGAKRAAAGHPEPFNLEYVGIGNEDKMTPEFLERFKMIYQVVHEKHPEIKVIGTAGPFYEGEDFEKGWKLSGELEFPIIDEHYYTSPSWFLSNMCRYDSYDRNASQVYLGEYASWGNKLINAIAEAAYMTSLERNGDLVRMASYAPMLAKKGFTQWKIDMIFFDNVHICPTPNYYVQKMFSMNQGDLYYSNVIAQEAKDTLHASSCVQDSKTGDIILKLVNAGKEERVMKINLAGFKIIFPDAALTVLSGDAEAENTFENPREVVPSVSTLKVRKAFEYAAPAMSLTVMRIKTKK
jgi:alpha-L-arabinofuranosidase